MDAGNAARPTMDRTSLPTPRGVGTTLAFQHFRRDEDGRPSISRDRDRVLGARWRHPPREVLSADGADRARLAGAELFLPGVHRVGSPAARGADARRRRDLAPDAPLGRRVRTPSTLVRRSPPAWPG